VLHRSDLVTALQWLIGRANEQYGLHVQFEADATRHIESLPLKVFIFRAVQELLSNAAKHAGVKSVRVTMSRRHDLDIVTVSDKGRGFNAGILDATTEKSGFGLLSLRERASYMGGSLAIQTAPGQGCRATLTIPLRLPEAGMKHETSEPLGIQISEGSFPQSIRVMFATDHLVMRQCLVRFIPSHPDIELAGEASNGREAIEQARKLRPDVILMDVSLPEIDGITATRRIIAELPNVRILGLCIHEDAHLAMKMRQAGARVILNKSTTSSELLKAIYDISEDISGGSGEISGNHTS
jgi:CheY-like chemotaxis protein